jgi:transcriptional regulator GlxA family with amidase domain
VRFLSGQPVSAALGRHWISAAETYRDLLADPVLWRTAAVRTATFRHLAVVTLEAFRQEGDPRARDRAAADLTDGFHRATTFIDDHASLPISATDIAEGAELSATELDRAFESHSASTPAERLREARLAAAHADLVRADATKGDTVERIAQRWGFTYPGDFAKRYRERYGRAPRETLDS